jgi:hypothetical protein
MWGTQGEKQFEKGEKNAGGGEGRMKLGLEGEKAKMRFGHAKSLSLAQKQEFLGQMATSFSGVIFLGENQNEKRYLRLYETPPVFVIFNGICEIFALNQKRVGIPGQEPIFEWGKGMIWCHQKASNCFQWPFTTD